MRMLIITMSMFSSVSYINSTLRRLVFHFLYLCAFFSHTRRSTSMESKFVSLSQMRVPMYLAVNTISDDGTLIAKVVAPQRGK